MRRLRKQQYHEQRGRKGATGAAAGTSPPATLNYVAAESNSMAQPQASGVEPSDSNSSGRSGTSLCQQSSRSRRQVLVHWAFMLLDYSFHLEQGQQLQHQ
jgi:hypothetical protein